ncbi:MAG TPA: hypothetical protein DDX03_05120 [Firmicutes bacterium]|nr:hypothetical protein [Bacillota bacterium]
MLLARNDPIGDRLILIIIRDEWEQSCGGALGTVLKVQNPLFWKSALLEPSPKFQIEAGTLWCLRPGIVFDYYSIMTM